MADPRWQTAPAPPPPPLDSFDSSSPGPGGPSVPNHPVLSSALRPRAPSNPKRLLGAPPPPPPSASSPFPPRWASNTNAAPLPTLSQDVYVPPARLGPPPRPPPQMQRPPRNMMFGKSQSERRMVNPRARPAVPAGEPFAEEQGRGSRPQSAQLSPVRGNSPVSMEPPPPPRRLDSSLAQPALLSPGVFPPRRFGPDGSASNTSSLSINSTPAMRTTPLVVSDYQSRPFPPRSVSVPQPPPPQPMFAHPPPRKDSIASQTRDATEVKDNSTSGQASARDSSASQLTTGSSAQDPSGTDRSSIQSSGSELGRPTGWPKIRDDDEMSVDDCLDLYAEGFNDGGSEPTSPLPISPQDAPRKPSLPQLGHLDPVAEDPYPPVPPVLSAVSTNSETDYFAQNVQPPSPVTSSSVQNTPTFSFEPPQLASRHSRNLTNGTSGTATPRAGTPDMVPDIQLSPPEPPKTADGHPMISVVPRDSMLPRPNTAFRSPQFPRSSIASRDSFASARAGMPPRARMLHAPVKVGNMNMNGLPRSLGAGPRTSAQIIAGLFDPNAEPEKDPKDSWPHRDRYGFKKETQHIQEQQYDAWNVYYSRYLERRRVKWSELMRANNLDFESPTVFPPKSDKVKRFVRKGIPPDWRGAAWFFYSGGPERVAQSPRLYFELSNQAERGEMSEADREHIERDLNRTFPDNIKFKPDPEAAPAGLQASPLNPNGQGEPDTETPMIKSLRRVLRSFAIHNPKIGYCQSLNFLAGQMLLFLNGDEEKAFHLLEILTSEHLPGTHGIALEGANVDIGVLMQSIKDAMPAVWSQLDDNNSRGNVDMRTSTGLPTVSLATTAWFMSCFIGTLPVETACRVWDCLFYEGSKTLFRVALGIFKLNEDEIQRLRDPMEVFQLVQTMPRKLIDANLLMEATFGRNLQSRGLMSQESVEQMRHQRRVMYKAEREPGFIPPPVPEDEKPRRGLSRKGTLRRLRSRRIKVPS